MDQMDRIGTRSVLTCPDCNGIMWEIDEGDLVRYRCHVGNAYSSDLMGLAVEENLTRALGTALRALSERTAVAEKLHRQAKDNGSMQMAESWARKAQEYAQEAQVIRDSIRRADELAAHYADAQ